MRRFIRYLYEYEQGMRSRNVGFVKVEQEDMESVVHIHGKGLRMNSGDSLSLYLFYEEDERFIKILQGEIPYGNPAVNYRFRYTAEDAGGPENYDEIDGILLVSSAGRKFVAVWDREGPIDVDHMILQEEVKRPEEERMPEEMPPREEEQRPGEMPSREEEQRPGMMPPRGEEQRPGEMPPREEEQMPGMMPPRGEEQRPGEMPPQEEEQRPGMMPPREEEQRPGEMPPREEEQPAPGNPEVMTSSFPHSGELSRQWKVTKIQRRELSMLPRCEWRLANNNFLLHGYYNYRHLILIDDGQILKLGIPGIYHEKEARAAETFGFPEFIEGNEIHLNLSPEECNEHEIFGYWCRQVRRPMM